MCLCVYVCLLVNSGLCLHWFCSLDTIYPPGFFDRVSYWLGTFQVGWTGLLASPTDVSVCFCLPSTGITSSRDCAWGPASRTPFSTQEMIKQTQRLSSVCISYSSCSCVQILDLKQLKRSRAYWETTVRYSWEGLAAGAWDDPQMCALQAGVVMLLKWTSVYVQEGLYSLGILFLSKCLTQGFAT